MKNEIKKQKNTKEKGSPNTDEPEFICIGKVHRAHGLEGAVVFNPMTDFPERMRRGRKVYLGDARQVLHIATVRTKPPYLLLQFKEITTPEEASEMTNQYLFVHLSELPPLPEGRYYFHELIGLDAVDLDGNRIGKVADVFATGANDVYVIQPDEGAEILAAGIPEVIREVLLDKKAIIMNLPDWY